MTYLQDHNLDFITIIINIFRSILKKETDMYLNSGMSCTIRKSDTNELIGCTFFTTWKRDEDYEIVEETSLDWWHNIAAEIAMQEHPVNPQVR